MEQKGEYRGNTMKNPIGGPPNSTCFKFSVWHRRGRKKPCHDQKWAEEHNAQIWKKNGP